MFVYALDASTEAHGNLKLDLVPAAVSTTTVLAGGTTDQHQAPNEVSLLFGPLNSILASAIEMGPHIVAICGMLE